LVPFFVRMYPDPDNRKEKEMIKIRKSMTGKLHLSLGSAAAFCSSGNRGMNFVGCVPAKSAYLYPSKMFCKKCFGNDPVGYIAKMIETEGRVA